MAAAVQKQKFDYFLKPIDSILGNVYAIMALWLLFSPRFIDFVILFAVDIPALIIVHIASSHLLHKLHGEIKIFFPFFDEEKINALSPTDKIMFVKSFMRFPFWRAMNIFYTSFVKVIPGGIVVVYFWPHPHLSEMNSWIRFWGFEFLIFLYLTSCVYISIHEKVTEKLGELHLRGGHDWVEVFREIKWSAIELDKSNSFITFEAVSIFAISSMAFFSTIMYLYFNPELTPWGGLFTLGVFLLFGLIFFTRSYFSYRNYFFNGLSRIFHHFLGGKDGQGRLARLPLHSDLRLSSFVHTYNKLLDHLESRDQAIKRFFDHETEQAQVRILGECAGLIAHDLAGPLHTMLFCLAEIKENSKRDNLDNYLQHLESSLGRAQELVESFKAQIRNPDHGSGSSSLSQSFKYTVNVLKTQFRARGGGLVQFSLQESLQGVELGLSRLNMVHILYNLMKNAMENMLENNIVTPQIRIIDGGVERHEKGEMRRVLLICDNGTGLSPAKFAELTQTDFAIHQSVPGSQRGLGLRLTRRLVERLQGKIEINNEDKGLNGSRGTCFRLCLLQGGGDHVSHG